MNSERKLKICHVITRMIVGGAQENTLLTIKGHLAKGHENVLITGPSEGREGKLLQNFADLAGLKIVEAKDLVRELSIWHDLKAYFFLRRYFRENRFDIVHTHSSKAGIIARCAATAAGVPVVVHTVHGQAFTPYEKSWRNAVYILAEKFAAGRCCKIFAVAQAMIDQCVAKKIAPKEKYMVVYSGMETTKFISAKRDEALCRKLGLTPGSPVVMTLARLFPQKGYEFVPEAFAKVVETIPDAQLLIIGDGILREKLMSDFEKLGVSGQVRFAGLVPPDQVPGYLACGDLLWHLSLREGLPRAAVQALCEAKPVIGFALDGTPEVVINGKSGFCLAPGDVSGVAKHTIELFSDAELRRRTGDFGRELVSAKFDWQRMADILEKEYFRLMEAANK